MADVLYNNHKNKTEKLQKYTIINVFVNTGSPSLFLSPERGNTNSNIFGPELTMSK